MHHEVLGAEPRNTLRGADTCRSLALHSVHHGFLDVEVKDVTELVAFALLFSLASLTAARDGVVTKAVATEPGKEVAQGLLADLTGAARGEAHAFVVALDQPAPLQLIGEALRAIEIASRVITEQVAQRFTRRRVELLAAVYAAKRSLHLLDGLELIHHAHRLVERHLLAAQE